MEKMNMPAKPTMSIVICAVIFAVVFWLFNWWYGQTLTFEDRGTFGDMFGAVNSLFSGLAFVGVIYAITMQRHEIAIAREDIRYTKKILDEQRAQLVQQNEEAKKQTFETTFFQLVKLYSDITNQIEYQRINKGVLIPTKGKDVFPVFIKRLNNTYDQRIKGRSGGKEVSEAYEEFYTKHNSKLGHYFRTIYNIIKFIDNADIADKKFYSNIVRAQLSDEEVALLFHNGISKYGREKFKPLMERYGLLKNVNKGDRFIAILTDNYITSAFGEIAE